MKAHGLICSARARDDLILELTTVLLQALKTGLKLSLALFRKMPGCSLHKLSGALHHKGQIIHQLLKRSLLRNQVFIIEFHELTFTSTLDERERPGLRHIKPIRSKRNTPFF